MYVSSPKGESSAIEADSTAAAAADSMRESFDQANDQSGTSFPHDDDDDEDDDDDDSVLTSANLRMDEDDDSHYEECSNPYSNSEHAYSSGIVCSVSILTYLLTYLLTACSTVLEKLTGFAASQEIPRIFGTRRFITVLTSAHHLSLS